MQRGGKFTMRAFVRDMLLQWDNWLIYAAVCPQDDGSGDEVLSLEGEIRVSQMSIVDGVYIESKEVSKFE